jgi:hypothetical protein
MLLNPAISYLNRWWISIYSYLPAHGEDSPTTAPLTNSGDFSEISFGVGGGTASKLIKTP